MRRTYYDHEDAYRKIRAAGGRGWDDLSPGASNNSYAALDDFLASPYCPNAGSSSSVARAIDLGCGGGQATIRLAQHGLQTTGVDFSPTAIALAQSNAAELTLAIEFHVADCLNLALIPSHTFDLAVDNHTLHCMIGDDRHRFLTEVARVLKPGGIFFSETMSAEGSPDFKALGINPITRIDHHRTRYWVTRSELAREIEASGFTIKTIIARPQPDTPCPGDTLVTVAIRNA